jgi:hypothetical protein
VIEITPKIIALFVYKPQWDVEGFQPYYDILNVIKREAHRISTKEGYKAPAYREQ